MEKKNEVNFFKCEMTKAEQIEFSWLLDKFMQDYENGFLNVTDIDEDAVDDLQYEFKTLYEFINMLSDRALSED